MNTRNALLLNRKFREFLLPTILTSTAVSLASIVDGIIVGGLLGERALAAVGLSAPAVLALNMLFYLFAVGGIAASSRAKGARDTDSADRYFTLCILWGTLLSAAYALAVSTFSAQISTLLSPADADLAEQVRQYIAPVVWTAPFLAFSLTVAQFWKSDGNPKAATLVVLIANGVNLLLDYVLIRFLGTGIMGAGLSTTLGYLAGALATLPYWRSSKRSFHFVKVKAVLTHTLQIIKGGAYRALQSLSAVVQTLVINALIVSIYGSVGMTAMTVCNNAQMIALIFSGGITETLLPILSTLSGEKDSFGIRAALKTAIWALLGAVLCITAFFIAAPGAMGALFHVTGVEGRAVLYPALRFFALSLPFCALNQLFQNCYGSTGRGWLATAIPVVDSFVLLIGYALLFTSVNGHLIWLSYVCAEATTVLLVYIVSRVLRKKDPSLSGLFLLPAENDQDRWEATIRVDAPSSVSVSQQLIDFCNDKQIDTKLACHLGLCAEEYCMNTATVNRQKHAPTMDLLLSLTPAEILLRLRDDGALYDPLAEGLPEDLPEGLSEELSFTHISLVKKLASKVEYSHQLGFNTTVLLFQTEPLTSHIQ